MQASFHPKLIPLHKKKAYLRSFSEDDFRDKVVRPLFCFRGMIHAKDVCGVNEEGKDCYFWFSDPVREKALYAVQTKKGDLKMSSSAKDNVIRAITQLETAVKTAVYDGPGKRKLYPTCVLLVASGEMNEAAQRHIVDAVPDPRIVLQDSDTLIPFIDEFMPEFWNGIDTDKLPYLKSLRTLLLHRSNTIDISEIGVPSSTVAPITEDTFVQLYLNHYYPKLEKDGTGPPKDTLQFDEIKVHVVLERSERLILITGQGGSGKTTCLNRLAMILVDKALASSKPAEIPVCLEASLIADSDEALAVLAGKTTRTVNPQATSGFDIDELNSGRVVLLIDGLDELGTSEIRIKVLDTIRTFHITYPKCRIILATRDYQFVHDIITQYGFKRFHISPISFQQAQKMIQRLSTKKTLSESDTKEMLRRLENIHGLELNPLLVTVFVATSDYARTDVPANITELFKKFTELMLGRWHRTKGVSQQYHAPLKDFVLRQIAFGLHSQHRTSLRINECRDIIQMELESRDLVADVDTLYEEIVFKSGLLRVEDETIYFRHHLLQEFFAGRAIPSIGYLGTIVSDVWWTKAIVFYFGENPDSKLGLEELRNGIDKTIGGNEFQAAITVGLAAQACYLMQKEHKVEAAQWVVDRLATIKDKALASLTVNEAYSEFMPVACYYIYGRDAVASQSIRHVAKHIQEEIAGKNELSSHDETRIFWCIAGLIEAKCLDIADDMIRQFFPSDQRLMLMLLLGAIYVKRIHITNSKQKAQADAICNYIEPLVDQMREKLVKELKGVLLEARKGKLVAIEDDK